MLRHGFRKFALPSPRIVSRPIVTPRARPISVRHRSDVVVQSVRFLPRPYFSWKTAASWIIYSSAAYAYLNYVLSPLDDLIDEEEEEQLRPIRGDEEAAQEEGEEYDEEAELEEEIPEESIFIPIGWAKRKPQTFYRGSDPEWQEFLRLAGDIKRQHGLQRSLAVTIRRICSDDPAYTHRLGSVNVRQGKYWLEITFPDGPPAEYERSGIEITDEYIAWTRRAVTQRNYERLRNALQPYAVMSALYASARYLFNLQVAKAKQFFGFPTTPSLQEIQLRKALTEAHRRRAGPSGEQANQHSPSPEAPSKSVDGAPDPQQSSSKPFRGVPSGRAPEKEKNVGLPKLQSIPPSNVALSIFASTLRRRWKHPERMILPRGCVVVNGLVEVVGTKARCTMEVSAVFDPKMNKYMISGLLLKRIQDNEQPPRGGP
ncbi:hypothetical protein BDY21DRAFT_346158 [Lineolata rhizophorae]|uniref:Uncharacterized protein n=1 Tax=Lineolata rhizophorae TaxID=578093 RepID=A0A6A6NYK5_9PEZI|nr:hypothetical protein BDY21DRAFT_346158 [Lineolata rhizophorae]